MPLSINLNVFKTFIRSGSFGGILLLLCVIISLSVANSSCGPALERFLATEAGFNISTIHLRYSILLWINDGLMAVFFLMVGLEIKREILDGELSSFKRATLPIVAAAGGAIVPAIIYMLFTKGTTAASGWGIPMATDIAFALAVLSMLSKRVPASLKIFLAALAIADDLMAILVIAIFYSAGIHLLYLLFAGLVFLLMMVFNKMGVKNLFYYLIPGLFLWYFIHHSGIHATIAGVLTAFAIPSAREATASPLIKLEHFLIRPVNFIIMPLFALANTNIGINAGMVDGLYSSLGWGIIAGLLIGKPVGITLFSWLMVKAGWAELPSKVKWMHIAGLGILAGIGFTMSIFIALLSFADPVLQTEAKFAVLIASTIAGVMGYLLLRNTKLITSTSDDLR
jgi:NhaA family Na+:H+ antiporter